MAKPILFLSLTANFALLSALGLVLAKQHQKTEHREEPLAIETTSLIPPQPLASPGSAPEVKPFHWSQLEAPDYETYIANLKKIGCPEKTIHDIITADVADVFEKKRQMLLLQGMAPVDLARENAALLKQQQDIYAHLFSPQILPQETAQAIRKAASPIQSVQQSTGTPQAVPSRSIATAQVDSSASNLDSVKSSVAQNVAAPNGTPPGNSQSKPNAKITVPMALLPPDPSLQLTPEQKEQWNSLSQEFITAVGGTNQNPNDPTYQRRWQAAQAESDRIFYVLFGQSAFLRLQPEAAQITAP